MLKTNASVASVEDHMLLRNGLVNLIRGRETYAILFDAGNGKDFIKQLQPRHLRNVDLQEINVPGMEPIETERVLKRNYPNVKILALSLYDNESASIRMMKNGAKFYILKDIAPLAFSRALDWFILNGFYYSQLISGKLIRADDQLDEPEEMNKKCVPLNGRELNFLKLACTEMTYKEIAEQMYLSARTIDGYRDALFEKLNVKSRVGLVLYAIKNNIVIV